MTGEACPGGTASWEQGTRLTPRVARSRSLPPHEPACPPVPPGLLVQPVHFRHRVEVVRGARHPAHPGDQLREPPELPALGLARPFSGPGQTGPLGAGGALAGDELPAARGALLYVTVGLVEGAGLGT